MPELFARRVAPRGLLQLVAKVALIAVAAFGYLAAVPSGRSQIAAGDDFNDNARDISKWGEADYPAGNGELAEVNGRIEYRVASPDLAEGDESARPWTMYRPGNMNDWELVLDVVNTAIPPANDRVATFGLEVFNASDLNDYVYVELYASTLFIPSLRRGFKAGVAVDGDDLADILPLADSGDLQVTSGSVRLLFDSKKKVFHAWYDLDGSLNGHAWIWFASFGISGSGGSSTNADWHMPDGAEFQAAVYGFSAGMTISGGTVFGDDFFLQTAASARPELDIAKDGNQVELRWPQSALGYELETSMTPSGSWSAVTNVPVTMNGITKVGLAAPGREQFFRLRR